MFIVHLFPINISMRMALFLVQQGWLW